MHVNLEGFMNVTSLSQSIKTPESSIGGETKTEDELITLGLGHVKANQYSDLHYKINVEIEVNKSHIPCNFWEWENCNLDGGVTAQW